MTIDAYISVLVVSAVFAVLVSSKISADMIVMCALAVLIFTGVLTPPEALAGFANPGVITIGTLYIVASGLSETGAIQWMAARLLGKPTGSRNAISKVILPSSVMSAFMNNTAVVAMFIPSIQDWANRINVAPSKLLIPLSYAAILGGTCTLVGTSTNLVIDGLLQERLGVELGMFSIAWVGLPMLLVGGVFMYLFSNKLLPERRGAIDKLGAVREYSVEMFVEPQSGLGGKTIEEANLRSLTHGYLVEIRRTNRILSAVSPDTILMPEDVLIFVGAPECARELRQVQGLVPVHGDAQKLDISHHERCLVEAVIGPDFVGLDRTIRSARFRSRFQAAVLSVSRNGSRIDGKIGDITLQVGDTLLLETGQHFVSQYRSRRDFLLVSAINDSTPPDFRRAPLALGILGCMVLLSATGMTSILEAALVAAGLMLITGCVSPAQARRSVDLSVLVVVAGSFSLGLAMTKTGAAESIAGLLLFKDDLSPWLMLAVVYVTTVVFTEMITNNAAAVLMFPIAISIAEQLNVNFMPFVVAVMFAASASFITPLGYQTNLMVMGAGGYNARDFVRLGLPLSLLVGMTSILLIPMVWNF